MSLAKEFRDFAMRGNVVDLAVGIIIGGAFGKIVSSLVDNVIMPPIGVLVGGVDFTDLKLKIRDGVDGAAPVMLEYGKFIQNIVDFTIVAFAIFMLVKVMNKLKAKDAAAPEAPPTRDQVLLMEIRDALKK